MANNVFGLIKSNSRGLTAEKLKSLFGSSTNSILTFPPGLGGAQDSGGASADIPYVIFAPYVRPTYSGLEALSSINYAKVLDELPPPKFAIALPLPASALKTTYGVTYDTFELGQYGILSSGLKTVYDTIVKEDKTDPASKGVKTGEAVVEAFKSAGASSLYAAVQAIGDAIAPSATGALDKMLGVKENPFTETLFKDVNIRSHEFNYSFHPRSFKESQTIDNILQLFKFYMLPAATSFAGTSVTTGGFFSFPYEFQITYSVSDTTFTLLPSVLESLDINYGGDSATPHFYVSDPDDASGRRYPSVINLNMTFKEIMFLTRDRIEATNSGSPDYEQAAAENPNFVRYRF